jgi:hypothetical protein
LLSDSSWTFPRLLKLRKRGEELSENVMFPPTVANVEDESEEIELLEQTNSPGTDSGPSRVIAPAAADGRKMLLRVGCTCCDGRDVVLCCDCGGILRA